MVMQFEYRSREFDIKGYSEDDHIYRQIAHSASFYEIDLLEYINRIRPFILRERYENIAVDIGANIGNHSVFLGAFLADHLIAIEPNPDVAPTLECNLSKNLCHYTLFKCAVGEEEGQGSICVPEHMSDNIGAAKIEPGNSGAIRISTLDTILCAWKGQSTSPHCVSLIKIDVEGMELQVLKGSENTIRAHKPHIFAEAADCKELEAISAYLSSLGYRRMLGYWAATPVYHFAHNPSLSLLATACYSQLGKMASIVMARMTRYWGK